MGRGFDIFYSSSSVTFSSFGRKILSVSVVEKSMLSRGSWRLKI